MAALAQVGEATWWEALTRRGLRAIRAGSFERDTKVNRCLTEGRRAFFDRLAGIEGGGECERLDPLLSALADGEVGAGDLATLRSHLKSCLSCRARLRAYRDAPARVAALAPATALGGDGGGSARAWLESLLGAAQHKAATFGERMHAAAELATGQKVAAMAASAAAIAGGGVAADRPKGKEAAPAERTARHPVEKPAKAPPVRPPPAPVPKPTPRPPPAASRAPSPPPSPAREFAPAAAAPASSPPASAGGGGSPGGGEFGP